MKNFEQLVNESMQAKDVDDLLKIWSDSWEILRSDPVVVPARRDLVCRWSTIQWQYSRVSDFAQALVLLICDWAEFCSWLRDHTYHDTCPETPDFVFVVRNLREVLEYVAFVFGDAGQPSGKKLFAHLKSE